ncbi:MAG: NUDIX hydrolase [Dehalococcoidales bacterium]|nr:NUDIX hydrolase [Dehalococcoidales bacterium]
MNNNKVREARAQCLIHRGNRVLLVKCYLKFHKKAFWLLPGGGIEKGETPEEAALRELKEECCVDGVIIRKVQVEDFTETSSIYNYYHTFLIDIGDQKPELGEDPDIPEPVLQEVKWMTLDEISETEKTFLFSSGLLLIEDFRREVLGWREDRKPDFSK